MKKITVCLLALMLGAAGGVYPIKASAAAASYEETAAVSRTDSGLCTEPTAVLEPDSFDDLVQGGPIPVSAILTPDADMAVSLGGESKGLGQVFDEYMKGEIIPVIRLTSETADAFLDWLKEEYFIADIMAVSSDISVLQKLYADETGYLVNTVYDLTDKEIPADRYGTWTYLGEANAAGCNILMYDASDENLAVAAEYTAAMTKVCWAYAEGEIEAVKAIAAGCYGVVAPEKEMLSGALAFFEEPGLAQPRFIAAHRGITAYANENSLTAIAASANEGATHIEIDLQISSDGRIMVCHDSSTDNTSIPGWTFATSSSEDLKKLTLTDYSNRYGDGYPYLEEVLDMMSGTDVIFIFELKFDGCSSRAVNQLKAVETLAAVMEKYPEAEGRWYAITFFAPLAEKMREVLPEIPVGFLGTQWVSGIESDEGKQSWNGEGTEMTNIGGKIAFLRRYNVVLDETFGESANATVQDYLARGYTQNAWTFADAASLFSANVNIATTDAAEQSAMFVREIRSPQSVSPADLQAGRVTAECVAYNGWMTERECRMITVENRGDSALVLLWYEQRSDADSSVLYGLYSELFEVAIA